jgi:chemotaxis protein methyltransferase CheR
MNNNSTISPSVFTTQQLSNNQFIKLAAFISNNYGIKMPENKKTTLQCRLQKRLKTLQIDNFSDYLDYVYSKEGQVNELMHMMDEVSTNKTDFFRENDHFIYLTKKVLPELTANMKATETFTIWSAGSSSGEEAYTIAFTLEEFQARNYSFDYKIFGTDISNRIIKQAVDAIYPEEKVEIIPVDLKKKYLLKSKNRENPTVRVKSKIRKKVTFNRQNLMEKQYNVPGDMDIIFCRNVLIYFNHETQERVLRKLVSKLKKGGYLFLGHSESITNMDLPLIRIKPTVFKKKF